MIRRLSPPAIAIAVVVAGYALISAQSAGRDSYEATIHRASYGIPHIVAKDFGSLGFGEGYAFAQDHLCSLADQIVLARGERSRFFGPGEKDAHVLSDVAMKALQVAELGAEDLKQLPADGRAQLTGYAAGYNAYLAEVGVDHISGWCRGAAWVRPITAEDLGARTRLVTLTLTNFAPLIATAAPPGARGSTDDVEMPDLTPGLSNGWAIGRERSATGRGLLLANPHYPWVGSNRFWEKHLTIPGRFDVYGVSLLGSPGVAIGFNRHVAWTHTVSAGARYTGYRLTLVPGSPTTYVYDGGTRQMTPRDVHVDVRQPDGSTKRVSRTVYFSHYGPVVNFPGLPWTAARAVAIRDANAGNNEGWETYAAMARATTLDDVKRAHAIGGISFVNTMVATADGRAFYIDAASAPHLSKHAIDWWTKQVAIDDELNTAYGRGLMLLDGSDSRFEWVSDSRARDAGVVPAVLVPQLERSDYVFNANDSYWVSHARALLTGFSPAHGREGTARSLRTRMNIRLLDDTSATGPSGADGRFSVDEVWAAVFSNRAMSAELLRAPLVERCERTPEVTVGDVRVALGGACAVLAKWDGTLNLDSGGGVLWREFVSQFRTFGDLSRIFATPFDAADPAGTPRGLAAGDKGTLEALGRAVQILERAGLPLDAPIGRVQFAQRGERRIPVHGGLGGEEGIANFVSYSPNRTTLEPDAAVAPLVQGSRYLTRDGYPINGGSSFVMAVGFTDAGPRGRAVLTYGQSGDPRSAHFSDQTELFSRKGWREIRFSEKDIRADRALVTKTVRGSR